MPGKKSAGLLVHRLREGRLQVLLVHPGGPFWARKEQHCWSIPKGEIQAGEEPLDAAVREFQEETGCAASGPYMPLAPVVQAGGKTVLAWAVQGDFDPSQLRSNAFSMEWPPRSGRLQEFPEVDRAAWFEIPVAKERILKGQIGLLDQLAGLVALPSPERQPSASGAGRPREPQTRPAASPGQARGGER
ncbi:MAG TPA: NUDIX domain-containing protein [bacterium]|nr:NUDIX domain-containing protein [bacterium]